MAEYDYAVPSLKVKLSSVFKLGEIYKVLKSWFETHRYYLMENEYSDTDKKQLDVKWTATRDVDDYSRFTIEINIKAKDIEHIEIKNRKVNRGSVEVVFASYIKSDYEDYWDEKGTSKFLRGIYDKFALKSKMNDYNSQLKEDTYAAFEEVKSYLRLHVLK